MAARSPDEEMIIRVERRSNKVEVLTRADALECQL